MSKNGVYLWSEVVHWAVTRAGVGWPGSVNSAWLIKVKMNGGKLGSFVSPWGVFNGAEWQS